MSYVDDGMKYKNGGMDANRARSMKLVDPELAQMMRSGNYQLPPSSASAPDKIPMRPYKKGGSVKPAMKMMKEKRMCKAKGGEVDIEIVSMRPRKSEAASRRKDDIGYDDKIMKDARGAFKEDMPHSKKETMMHKDRLMRLEKAKKANERGLKLDEHEMRKGGEMKKSAKKSCYKMGGEATQKYAAGGAAKVRKGMATQAGQIKKVVKVHRPNCM